MDVIGKLNKKILSYSFFSPKNLHTHLRFWDNFNSTDRYWFNIPSMIVLNRIFYPDFIIRVHTSKEIKFHPYFGILKLISDKIRNVEIVEMDYDYTNTEPTMWRYKPLFDKDCDLVLCRDIDSIPNFDEILATKFFIQNPNYKAHTLRTHTNHTSYATIILAGLCGFRPKEIPFIQSFGFEQYYNHFKSEHWGLDQNSLISMFLNNPTWTEKFFLDSPISSIHHTVGNPLLPCVSRNQEFYRLNADIPNVTEDLIKFLNECTIWGGEPTDIRGSKLLQLLSLNFEICRDIKNIIEELPSEIQNFYFTNV